MAKNKSESMKMQGRKEADKKTAAKPEKTAPDKEQKPEQPVALKQKKEQKAQKEKIVKTRIEKTPAIRKLREKIRKKKHPVFRGRFGKRKLRRASKEKWDKWRKPRGIDIVKRKEDGAWPKTGYRTPIEIRGRHPSGYYAKIVNNVKELELVSGLKETGAVIAGNVGRKKRKEILKKAGELKIVVLNR